MVITIGNLLPLDAELKEQFQQLFRAIKRNSTALAKQAFQIHSEHYSRTDRKYDKDFEVWWEAQGLEHFWQPWKLDKMVSGWRSNRKSSCPI
ncbi:MAG: hypothetical protein ACM37Z_17960 [Deltaproteobacteria bacterium]